MFWAYRRSGRGGDPPSARLSLFCVFLFFSSFLTCARPSLASCLQSLLRPSVTCSLPRAARVSSLFGRVCCCCCLDLKPLGQRPAPPRPGPGTASFPIIHTDSRLKVLPVVLLGPASAVATTEMETPTYLQESVDASKAEYRRLGASGLKVSVPILGAMSYGDPAWAKWVLNEEEVSDPAGSTHCPTRQSSTEKTNVQPD